MIDLTRVIEAIASVRVDMDGLENADVVVMPECLSAETRHQREVTDRHLHTHGVLLCDRALTSSGTTIVQFPVRGRSTP
jgi:hypothetical protein